MGFHCGSYSWPFSSSIIDLPVHVADLPLWGDEYKVGFGLWDRPLIAFVLEAGVLLAGVAIYARYARAKLAVWIFATVMLGIQYSNTVLPPPESPTQFAVMALSLYFGLAAAAWFVEKKWGTSTQVNVQ